MLVLVGAIQCLGSVGALGSINEGHGVVEEIQKKENAKKIRAAADKNARAVKARELGESKRAAEHAKENARKVRKAADKNARAVREREKIREGKKIN